MLTRRPGQLDQRDRMDQRDQRDRMEAAEILHIDGFMPPAGEQRPQRAKLLFAIAAVILIASAFWSWQGQNAPQVIIPGVPYYGLYTGTRLWNSAENATFSVLRYWGDQQVGTADVAAELGSLAAAGDPTGLSKIGQFLRSNGYLVRYQPLTSIRDLYPYLAANPPVPLLVHQYARPEVTDITLIRLVIGLERGDVIVHDNIFGSVFRIRIEDFLNLFPPSAKGFLVVTPSPEISARLRREMTPSAYPPRAPIMDDEGVRKLTFAWIRADVKRSANTPDKELLESWLQISQDEAFLRLHPTARIIAYNRIARLQTNLGKYNEAITTLREKSLPLFQLDISAPFNGWERGEKDATLAARFRAIPWFYLGNAYTGLKNGKEAKAAFQRALEFDPTYTDAQRALKSVVN